MTISIEYEAGQDLGIDCSELACAVAEKVLDMEGCPYEVSVNLVITDDEEIRQVNEKFRDIAAPTDVLSFPMISFSSPLDFSPVESDDSFFDLDTGELLLGDIMISADRVISQAKEYGHSVKREFSFLVAHSMLHLLGYDHMTEEDAVRMEEKQEKALNELGITR